MDSTINFNTYVPSENCANYFFWYLCQFCSRAFCKLDDCISHTVSLHRDDFLEAALDDEKQQLELWTESEIDGEAETELETEAEGETETHQASNECDDTADLEEAGTNINSASSPASGYVRSRLQRNATRHKDKEPQDNNENEGTKTTTTTGKRIFSHVKKKRTSKIVTTILKSGRKASQCRYCYKFLVSNFDDHEQMHVGGRAYTCRYCKKKFCWKNYLKYHEDRCGSRENPPKSFKKSKLTKSNENLSKSNEIIPSNAKTTRPRPSPQQRHSRPGTGTKSLTQGSIRKNNIPRIKLKSTARTAQFNLISNNKVDTTKNINIFPDPRSEVKMTNRHSVRKSSKIVTKTNRKQLKTGMELASKLKSKSSKLLILKQKQENVTETESPCWILRKRGGIPIYVCKVCGKGFDRKQNVKRHYQTHSGYKAYRCSTCPRAFSTKSVLIDHENQHLNIQIHSCQYCHKLFTWKSSKYLHERQRMCTQNQT